MELIIKPTSACNFKCTFCSAANLKIKHSLSKVPEQLKELICNLKPNNIIFTVQDILYIEFKKFLFRPGCMDASF